MSSRALPASPPSAAYDSPLPPASFSSAPDCSFPQLQPLLASAPGYLPKARNSLACSRTSLGFFLPVSPFRHPWWHSGSLMTWLPLPPHTFSVTSVLPNSIASHSPGDSPACSVCSSCAGFECSCPLLHLVNSASSFKAHSVSNSTKTSLPNWPLSLSCH